MIRTLSAIFVLVGAWSVAIGGQTPAADPWMAPGGSILNGPATAPARPLGRWARRFAVSPLSKTDGISSN